jgi:hypothetical protein
LQIDAAHKPKKIMKNLLILASLSLIVIQACKKTETVPAYQPPDSSFGLIYSKIMVTNCALSGCHASEAHAGHGHALTLLGDAAYTGLFNTNPQNSQALAAGLKIVAAGDTAKSFLYQKLIYNRSVHKYGAPMPLGGLKLTQNQITFVKLWIAAGAPKDGHVVDKTLLN